MRPLESCATPVADVEYPVDASGDDPLFREFFDYWKSLGSGYRCARRKDFCPTDVPKLLGWINVAEIIRSGDEMRFRFTLWGSKVTTLYDGDFTGYYIEEVMASTPNGAVDAAFKKVARECVPHYWQVPVPRPNREFVSYRRLALPFSDETGETVSHILALILPVKHPTYET